MNEDHINIPTDKSPNNQPKRTYQYSTNADSFRNDLPLTNNYQLYSKLTEGAIKNLEQTNNGNSPSKHFLTNSLSKERTKFNSLSHNRKTTHSIDSMETDNERKYRQSPQKKSHNNNYNNSLSKQNSMDILPFVGVTITKKKGNHNEAYKIRKGVYDLFGKTNLIVSLCSHNRSIGEDENDQSRDLEEKTFIKEKINHNKAVALGKIKEFERIELRTIDRSRNEKSADIAKNNKTIELTRNTNDKSIDETRFKTRSSIKDPKKDIIKDLLEDKKRNRIQELLNKNNNYQEKIKEMFYNKKDTNEIVKSMMKESRRYKEKYREKDKEMLSEMFKEKEKPPERIRQVYQPYSRNNLMKLNHNNSLNFEKLLPTASNLDEILLKMRGSIKSNGTRNGSLCLFKKNELNKTQRHIKKKHDLLYSYEKHLQGKIKKIDDQSKLLMKRLSFNSVMLYEKELHTMIEVNTAKKKAKEAKKNKNKPVKPKESTRCLLPKIDHHNECEDFDLTLQEECIYSKLVDRLTHHFSCTFPLFKYFDLYKELLKKIDKLKGQNEPSQGYIIDNFLIDFTNKKRNHVVSNTNAAIANYYDQDRDFEEANLMYINSLILRDWKAITNNKAFDNRNILSSGRTPSNKYDNSNSQSLRKPSMRGHYSSPRKFKKAKENMVFSIFTSHTLFTKVPRMIVNEVDVINENESDS